MNDRSTNRTGAPGGAAGPTLPDVGGLREVEGCSTGAQVPAGVCGVAAPAGVGIARQGCLYDFNGRAVIALKTGSHVPVEYVEPVTVFADAADLVPLAMRYFHGMVSK